MSNDKNQDTNSHESHTTQDDEISQAKNGQPLPIFQIAIESRTHETKAQGLKGIKNTLIEITDFENIESFYEIIIKNNVQKIDKVNQYYFCATGCWQDINQDQSIIKDDDDGHHYISKRRKDHLNNDAYYEAIVIDGDNGLDDNPICSAKEIHEFLKSLNLNHFVYSSYSNGIDSKTKWRAVIECKCPLQYFDVTTRKITKEAQEAGLSIAFANENKDFVRIWFFGGSANHELYENYSFFEGHSFEVVEDTRSDESGNDSKAENYGDSDQTLEDYEKIISECIPDTGVHYIIIKYMKQIIKDNKNPTLKGITLQMKAFMYLCPESNRNAKGSKWQEYLDDMPRQIQSSILKFKNENRSFLNDYTIEEFKDIVNLPFPKEFLELLPESLKIQFSNFKECIYDPIDCMYVTFALTEFAGCLQTKFVNSRGRNPTLSFSVQSDSGNGKDDNTVEALATFKKHVIAKCSLSASTSALNSALSPVTRSFTSGTTLLRCMLNNDYPTVNESFGDTKKTVEGSGKKKTIIEESVSYGAVIVDTEANSYYRNIGQENNSHMSDEVMKVEVTAFNGLAPISGRLVTSDSSNHMPDINNPNFSFYRMAQSIGMKNAYKMRMIENGYYGRLIDIIDDRPYQEHEPSGKRNRKILNFNDDGFAFMSYLSTLVYKLDYKIIVECNNVDSDIYNWEINNIEKARKVLQKEIGNDDCYPAIKRFGQMAEKIITIVVAYEYIWRLYKGLPVDDLILETKIKATKSIKEDEPTDRVTVLDGSKYEYCVIPLLDYVLGIKLSNITSKISVDNLNIVNVTTHKHLDNIVQQYIKDAKAKTKCKENKTYGNWLNDGNIPFAMLYDKISKDKNIIPLFSDAKSAELLKREIKSYLKDNGFKLEEIECSELKRKKLCVLMS